MITPLRRESGVPGLGRKRANLACECEKAAGEFIAYRDDHDWYASDRLCHQVASGTGGRGEPTDDGYRKGGTAPNQPPGDPGGGRRGCGVAFAAAAWGYDPDWLVVRRYAVSVPRLDRVTRVVQVSDLHADQDGSCSLLLRERVAEAVRRESPDWVFATGDYITRPGDSIEEATSWVAGLNAPRAFSP